MNIVNMDTFLEAVNRDAEFAIAARYCNITVKFEMGDDKHLITLQDGKIVGILSDLGPMEDWDWNLHISGPHDGWMKLLQPIPEPFYQAILPATLFHGFTIGGDFMSFCSYYRAFSRMIELMRLHTTIKTQ
jgi:hypothetical protein